MNTLGRGFIYSTAIHCTAVVAIVFAQTQIPLNLSRAVDLTLLVLNGEHKGPSPGNGSFKLPDQTNQPKTQKPQTLPEIEKPTEQKNTASPDADKNIFAAAMSPEPVSRNEGPSVQKTDYRLDAGPDMPATEAFRSTGTGPATGNPTGQGGVFKADDLDQPPVAVSRMPPFYPLQARRASIEGWVEIEFLVNVKGRVENVQIIEAIPPGVFEESVQQTASGWRFQPGTIMGKPVKTLVATTIRFELKDPS